MDSRTTEVVDEVSKWTVGLGILTLALAPLSLPFLILTAAALLPFVLPVVALGLLGAVLAVPFLLIRGLGRRLAGARRSGETRPQRGPVVPVPSRLGISSDH